MNRHCETPASGDLFVGFFLARLAVSGAQRTSSTTWPRRPAPAPVRAAPSALGRPSCAGCRFC